MDINHEWSIKISITYAKELKYIYEYYKYRGIQVGIAEVVLSDGTVIWKIVLN